MTNPDNIVRVRARNGGRASVYEANGWCQAFSTGLLEGKGVIQNTVADMNVLVGGSQAKPDVVIAETPSGYKIALDIVGQQPVALTAPGSGTRMTAIVAYTDDLSLSTDETNVTGSPSTCGLIAVNGLGAQPPTDSEIRTAITGDGATGSQAAFAVLATVSIGYQTTTIADSAISIKKAGVMSENVDSTTQIIGKTTNGETIYRKVIDFGQLPNNTSRIVPIGENIKQLYDFRFIVNQKDAKNFFLMAPWFGGNNIQATIADNNIQIITNSDRNAMTGIAIIDFTTN